MRIPAVLLMLTACGEPASDDPDDVVGDDPSLAPVAAYDPLDLVDPFVATGGVGAQIANVNPGASWPFGLTLVGPDTRESWGAAPFYHCAGYYYPDPFIGGFSLQHAHAMGVPEMGTIPFMVRDGWDDAFTREFGRMAPYDHDEEWARAGSYGVVLQDQDITVDMTASLHGGHVRAVFPGGAEPVWIFDLGKTLADDGEVPEASLSWDDEAGELELYQRLKQGYSGRFGGLQAHAVATFDPAPVAVGGWTDLDAPQAGLDTVDVSDPDGSVQAGLWLVFPEGTTTVEMRTAMSYVDHDGAWANHAAEVAEGSFDAHVAAAEEAWRERLEVVRVRGGSDVERRTFHTALYHSMLMPSRQDDVDGRYRGFDDAIHTADTPHYSDLSLWDTYRTIHPWYALAWPDVQLDVLRSMVRMIEEGGALPKWPLAHGYTGGMVGSPATMVMAESWLKGIRDWDADTAYEAALAAASGPIPANTRGGISGYLERGWVAHEESGGSVSRTIEHGWADHSLAAWADALGRPDGEALRAQSRGWPGLWDADAGFLVGHTTAGVSLWNDQPFYWDPWYVEGNAWHYVWQQPYDVEFMLDVQHDGDVDAFLARYRDYWAAVAEEPDDNFPDDWYWHGNEPVMHYAALGSLVGDVASSADAFRWVMANRYDDTPAGLDGNDDAGTLSAWYVLASTGLFPIAGTTTWAVGSPLWERLELDRADGSTLVIRAPGTSEDVRYPTDVRVGDTSLDRPQLTQEQLDLGEVVFTLSDEPTTWE